MRVIGLVFLFSWQIMYSKPSYQDNPTGDLPLHVLETAVQSNLPVFVFISGDGGWNKFNESLCTYLTQHGIPVVALDSQKYFWKIKTPDQTASDMIRVIETYQKLWKRDKFVLAGYSFGASIVPFLANRLPQNVKNNLVSIILITPDKRGEFEINLSDMLNLGLSKGKYDVLQEIQQGDSKKYLVIFSSDESENTRQAFQQAGLKTEILQGNHHFDNGYDAVAERIVEEEKK
ncbi:MAG TPA: AcvB/VirJ family lysyl-phosphatidylglycerol hydrolase [Prolixibacteraceae bacterium]